MELDDEVAEAIAQQAAEWWLLSRNGEMKDSEQASFLEWLRRSPAHVAAYLNVASASRDLRQAASLWPASVDQLVADAAAAPDSVDNVRRLPRANTARSGEAQLTRQPWQLALRALAAAMVLIAVAIGLVLRDGERFGLPRAYETAHAEQGSWPLPDGSVLHLNSDSRAVVRFSDGERLVTVERGQAMFQVAKDSRRRFRVDGGRAQIIAIGTEFDVYRRAAETRVIVHEGRVAVMRDEPAPGPSTLAIAGATALSAGEQIEVGPEKSAVAQPADMRRARAWLQREIVFDDLPLAQVVEDFNRYSSIPLEIEDEELKTLQISGVFGAYDVQSFLAFLRRLEGVRVDEGRSRIRIYLLQPEASHDSISVLNEPSRQ